MEKKMYTIPRIKTRGSMQLLTVAQTFARLSGHADATYQGIYSTQLVPDDTEHKYSAAVQIVIDPDPAYMPGTRRHLATIESGIRGPKEFTPEEALSHLTDDVHVIFSLPEVTSELIEQVQAELGGVNPPYNYQP